MACVALIACISIYKNLLCDKYNWLFLMRAVRNSLNFHGLVLNVYYGKTKGDDEFLYFLSLFSRKVTGFLPRARSLEDMQSTPLLPLTESFLCRINWTSGRERRLEYLTALLIAPCSKSKLPNLSLCILPLNI